MSGDTTITIRPIRDSGLDREWNMPRVVRVSPVIAQFLVWLALHAFAEWRSKAGCTCFEVTIDPNPEPHSKGPVSIEIGIVAAEYLCQLLRAVPHEVVEACPR